MLAGLEGKNKFSPQQEGVAMPKTKPSQKTPRHLKDDKVFKNFFKNHQEALISLLQSFLPLPEPRIIKKAEILDSFLPDGANPSGKKQSLLDLRLKLDNGDFVNVEMQLHEHPSFVERMIFYGCKSYFTQLGEGEQYKELHPSYSLVFCDFELFKHDEEDRKRFYRSCTIREDHYPNRVVSRHFRIVFVELSKLEKEIENLVDNKEAWCYVLKHLHEMGEEEKRLFASKNKQMEEIMDWTRKLTLEESAQIFAEDEEKRRRDRFAQDEFVFEKGKKQGLEKGIEKGRMELISNMLKKEADFSVISKLTGLSIEELKKLKNGS